MEKYRSKKYQAQLFQPLQPKVVSPQDQRVKITAMRRGGHILSQIRDELVRRTIVGTTFEEIERWAQELLKKNKVSASFSTVPNYHWATCVMRNDALCHGIPKFGVVADGDLVTIDIGLINEGYHLDTTTSFAVGAALPQVREFLSVGKKSLSSAISKVRSGVSVYTISKAMQRVLDAHGYGSVYQLTGHGIGKQLHMEPSIPVVANKADVNTVLSPGQTVAIEVMYTAGNPELVVANDNWTYVTKDGSISGMFEETVLVTETGCEVLTKSL